MPRAAPKPPVLQPSSPAKKPRKSRKSPGESPALTLGVSPAESPGASEIEEPIEDKLFPDAIEGTHRIRVQREDDYSKKLILHGYLSPDEGTEARMAELWGGGKYVVGLIGSDETGRQVIRRQNRISILGGYKRPGEIYGMQGSQPAAALPPGPGGISNAIGALPAGRISINEALDELRLKQVLDIVRTKESPVSAVPWERIFDMGVKLVEVFAGNRRDPNAELREEMARLREDMRRPATGPVTSGVEDMAKAISAILDIKERITDPTGDGGGRGEKDSGLMGIAGDILKMAMAGQAREAAGGQPTRIPGKTEVPPVPQSPPPPPPSSAPMWQQLLRQYRGQLVMFARRGVDPEWVIETVMNLISPDLMGVLQEFAMKPDAATIAIQEIPELGEFPTFNEALWKGLREAVSGVDDEEEGK